MMQQQTVFVPVSVGELVDKITILELKEEYITDPAKRSNITHELALLRDCLQDLVIPDINTLTQELKAVNRTLWQIENFKRDCEHRSKFDSEFVAAAREVYLKNDNRAAIKRHINQLTQSSILEEKSY